ncbi:MAG: hypothetical protein QOE27_2578 [Solirubrobacteraceae bacterium]|nr:hypothetical protein [Solirubrobacteraceae bacterium]
MKSANRSGQAYGFMALTPIKPGEEDALRAFLEGLRDRGPSPLSRLAATHMGRWVILRNFNWDPFYDQPDPDALSHPALIFSTCFDGDLDPYLDELSEALAPEAPEIWGRCIGCPDPARGPGLKAYLEHNQIDCGFFFAAYGSSTVAEVRASLDQRDRLVAFATRTQGLGSAELHRAFVAEFPGR